ncbi:MAG TPA: glucosamine-6-phosphate deaminase [Mucilaginibacter sp.]|nr:glucosamine-6-phosphate deaminase [Mucilaginibacter sp.]
MIRELKIDELEVKVFESRAKMGEAAASAVGEQIVKLLSQQEYVNIVFASAPSQNEFLAALIKQTGIDWKRVNAFHVDEYIGLPENAPQKFGSFLNEKIFKHLPFHELNYINGSAPDSFAECGRYAELLQQYPSDIVCLGIGENGHLAFNDPHVADLNDPVRVKIVDLDFECRRQQVTDGTFETLNSVPKLAITLTIPALMAGKYTYGIVPGKNKTIAVYNTLYRKISEQCPASVLRTHADAVLFLDADSAALIK